MLRRPDKRLRPVIERIAECINFCIVPSCIPGDSKDRDRGDIDASSERSRAQTKANASKAIWLVRYSFNRAASRTRPTQWSLQTPLLWGVMGVSFSDAVIDGPLGRRPRAIILSGPFGVRHRALSKGARGTSPGSGVRLHESTTEWTMQLPFAAVKRSREW
ncbi:uncharacterized protein ZHAS_00013560 [Anopheles sinensis]|uniref:Uncharacterized protein n=1 Tax=Anopheles sinensis TaxID=74873 RepID=A0A084W5S9_ANOSI|nr:uncharacterized protein ZHAS_00013560 [Anopheles sinensis]